MLDSAARINHTDSAGGSADNKLVHEALFSAQSGGLHGAWRVQMPDSNGSADKKPFIDIPPLDYGATKNNGTDNQPLTSSNLGERLIESARSHLGDNMTIPPKGSGVGHVPTRYGCAASLSNVMIDAKAATPAQFNPSVDGFENMVKHDFGAQVVPFSKLQKGDIVVGREERDGSHGRHVGFVDVDSHGKLVAYNNANGRLKSDLVDVRFGEGRYKVRYGLHFPESHETQDKQDTMMRLVLNTAEK